MAKNQNDDVQPLNTTSEKKDVDQQVKVTPAPMMCTELRWDPSKDSWKTQPVPCPIF